MRKINIWRDLTMKNLSNDCEQSNINYVTKSLIETVEKKVTIKIAQKDKKFLYDSEYHLCFAKKVGDKYTVVWRAYSREEYGPINTFYWFPRYEVFWTNRFQSNITVDVDSEKCKIFLGETTTIDKYGEFSKPADQGGDVHSLNIINEKGHLHLGVSQLLNEGSTPIYVAPLAMELGQAKLTPVEMVKVWFQQCILTSTMISDVSTRAYEIDLTEKNEYTVTYEDGNWLHK